MCDDPIIRRTGYPHEVVFPICPVCGEECEYIYTESDVIVGCNYCVRRLDAWDVPECFREENE